jgi:hypothetical protein
MSVTALKKVDERAELRRAVADAQQARAAVAVQHAAIERGKQLVQEAEANLAAARTNVATAREGHAQHIAKTIAGGGSPTSTGLIRAARATERDAEDDVEATKSALLKLEADLVLVETDAAVAAKSITRALTSTLEPLARRLIEEARAAHAHYLELQAAAVEVAGLWDSWHELRTEAGRVGLMSDADSRVSNASAAKWKSAIEAMRTDPDASLPPIEGS